MWEEREGMSGRVDAPNKEDETRPLRSTPHTRPDLGVHKVDEWDVFAAAQAAALAGRGRAAAAVAGRDRGALAAQRRGVVRAPGQADARQGRRGGRGGGQERGQHARHRGGFDVGGHGFLCRGAARRKEHCAQSRCARLTCFLL